MDIAKFRIKMETTRYNLEHFLRSGASHKLQTLTGSSHSFHKVPQNFLTGFYCCWTQLAPPAVERNSVSICLCFHPRTWMQFYLLILAVLFVCWVWHWAGKSGLRCRSCLCKTHTHRLNKLWVKAESDPYAQEEAKVWTRPHRGHMWWNMRGGICLASEQHLQSIHFKEKPLELEIGVIIWYM